MITRYVRPSTYGGSGVHTLRPQFLIRNGSVFATPYNTSMPRGKPLYNLRGGQWFSTAYHPDGKSIHPLYETRGDKIHTTVFHPEHDPARHAFVIR